MTEIMRVTLKYHNAYCADVRDLASYPAVVDWVGSKLEGEGLNVLVNSAGLAHWQGFDDITRELMLDCLESNCIAPLMMSKVLYSLYSAVLYFTLRWPLVLDFPGRSFISGMCTGLTLSWT